MISLHHSFLSSVVDALLVIINEASLSFQFLQAACALAGRSETSFALSGGGGGTTTGIRTPMERLSWTPRNEWHDLVWQQLSPTGEPPSPRCSHTATRVGDALIVFGGTLDVIRKMSEVMET